MAIIDQAIAVYVGEAVTLNFTMAPVESIAGWTLLFTVTRAQGSSTKVIEQAGEIVSAVAGTFRFQLMTEQNAVLPAAYHYDVWRTDAGNERLLALGTYTVANESRLPV